MIRTLAAGALALAIGGGAAQAAVVWNFTETGGDVVGAFAGSLDLTGAIRAFDTAGFDGQINPGNALVSQELASGDDIYFLSGGPSSFGTGSTTLATSSIGDSFGIDGPDAFAVPDGYTSGTALAGTLTFAGATFDSLGIVEGSYTFTIPNDTITLNFGDMAPVPLPAGLPLLLAGLGGLALMRRKAA